MHLHGHARENTWMGTTPNLKGQDRIPVTQCWLAFSLCSPYLYPAPLLPTLLDWPPCCLTWSTSPLLTLLDWSPCCLTPKPCLSDAASARHYKHSIPPHATLLLVHFQYATCRSVACSAMYLYSTPGQAIQSIHSVIGKYSKVLIFLWSPAHSVYSVRGPRGRALGDYPPSPGSATRYVTQALPKINNLANPNNT